MFDTIRRSFQLVKLCLQVLAADKELLLFPIFSAIGVGVVLLTFAGVGFGVGAFDRIEADGLAFDDVVVALVAALVFYVLAYFVIFFFNSALVFAAHERLAGGDPTIRSGIGGASKRIFTIFMWAVVAGTVGLILKILAGQAEESEGIFGLIARIFVALLGAAWTLLTFFVVPLIVIEHRPLGNAFKTSASMIRRTWGDQVAASIGLGIASLFAFLIAAGVAALLYFILSPLGAAGVITTIAVGAALVAAIVLIFSTLDGIYKAALYSYAATGEVPSLFPDEAIRGAFRQR